MADQDPGGFSAEDRIDAAEPDFVEMDVTGRYGRYNDILGKGAFKTVYRAFDEVDGIEVAWNQVKMHDLLQSSEESERLYSEVHLLRSLKHKNIIKFYTSWVDVKNKNVNFITEIFNSGTLRQYRKKHKHVDIKAVKNWARQILRGLLYLHSHDPPIIHRDLKCDNIFVNGNNGEVKIGDLGLATILRQAHAAHSVIGTPEFMAPELYEEEYNELVDIYSFGMCLLELVTFEYPYSECTNAAQIYKKVTSGKKPAALEKVRDPDVRKFIENCLAVASKRLPARELLSDPFLQNDASKEQPECSQSSRISLNLQVMLEKDEIPEGNNKEESGHVCVEDPSTLFQPAHHEPNDLKSAYLEHNVLRNDAHMECSCSNEQTRNEERELLTEPATLSKDDQRLRILDFRIKGKKRDDNTVSLRFRIANIQGHVRHIHFLFDVEGDTAISVASEMVEELQLSDQDVTTIAEMIDAKILALVPEWNPAASFEDAGPEADDHNLNRLSPDPELEKPKNMNDVDFSTETRTSSVKQEICPSLVRPSTCDASLARGEGMMHGRFEEVTYNHGSSDYSPSSSGAPPFVSQSCFDHQDYGESIFHEVDRTISPDFDTFEPSVWTTLIETAVDMRKDLPTASQNVENAACAFNDLVECQRNAGGSKYTHQSWERIMNLGVCSDEPVKYSASERDESGMGLNVESLWSSGGSDPITPTELTDGDEDFDEELKRLALEQEREVLELRKKHEEAILEAKNRRERKFRMTPPPNSVKSVAKSSLPLASDAVDSSISDSDSHKCLGGSSGELSQDVSQLSTVKGFGLSRESVHLEKISFDELAGTSNQSLLDSQISTTLEFETCTTTAQDSQGQLLPENLGMVSMEAIPLSDQFMEKIESGISVRANQGEVYGVNSCNVEEQISKTYPSTLEDLPKVHEMEHASSAVSIPVDTQECKDVSNEVDKCNLLSLKGLKLAHERDTTVHQICHEFRDVSFCKPSVSATIPVTEPKIFQAAEGGTWSGRNKSKVSNNSCEASSPNDTGSAPTIIHSRNRAAICKEFVSVEDSCSSGFWMPNDVHVVEGESVNARVSANQVGLNLESSSSLETQDGDRLLQLKREQLQRSIAKLEAKTLENLEHGLMVTDDSNRKGSSRHATSGIASQSQSKPA